MNISNNIAQITTYSAGQAKKTYLWAQYNSGRVYPVKPVNRKLENELTYIKPARREIFRLQEKAEDTNRMIYSLKGSLEKNSNIDRQPGTFFNAIA